MAKLTDEETKLLQKLTAKSEAPDADDYEILMEDGDKRVRLPASRGKAWVKAHFGVDLFDEPAAEGDGQDPGDAGDDGALPSDAPPSRTYFKGRNKTAP